MENFDEHELDKGFRRAIEGKGIAPPSSLWSNIRIAALERQLIHYQSMTLWFKGAIGILTALLSGTGYLLYQAKNTTPVVQKETVTVTKIDTVYLTKTERVLVDRPVVVYTQNGKNRMSQHETITAQNDLNDEINTTENNEKQGKNDDFNQIVKDSKSTLSSRNSKVVKNREFAKDKIGTIKAGIAERFAYQQKQNQGNSNLVTNEESNREAIVETSEAASEINPQTLTLLALDFLEPLQIHAGERLGVPKIKYNSPHKTPTKLPKVSIPLIDRLSLSAYVSPQWDRIDVRRNEPNAFNYGDEELQVGMTAGLRVGLQLSERWSVLTGVEYSQTSFDDHNRRQLLTAEAINGKIGYLYRTALGTVEIPAEKLSVPTQVGSVVGLEIHEPIQRYALNIPLLVRYDIWGKRFRFLNQVPMKVQFYGILGGYGQIPLGQEGHVEVYENSGRVFTGELTKFQNLRSSFGVNLGLGAEWSIGRHFNLFLEPNFTQGITSVVAKSPIRSVISGVGGKIGTKWSFGKR